MLTIETKELEISENLKKKVDMICKFACVKPKYKNGNLLYKEFFEKIRKVFKDELCDI